MFAFYLFLSNDDQTTIKQLLSRKKMKRGAILYILIGSLIAGISGFFAIHRWFVPAASPYLYIPVFSITCLLGIIMGEYAVASSENNLLEWLKQHPRGKEVIDECMRGE